MKFKHYNKQPIIISSPFKQPDSELQLHLIQFFDIRELTSFVHQRFSCLEILVTSN